MSKKVIGLALCSLLLVLCSGAEAQQTGKVPRIGFQFDSPLSALASRVEGFRQGLRELGYVEGKSIIIEWRSAEGKPERRDEIAADWPRLKVDIIVTGGPTTTAAVKRATSTIPIVMAFDNDPVSNGFVVSLARPGGNVTGLSTHAPEISGKQLELLKEIVPRLSRVAVLGSSTTPGNARSLKETELAAEAFAVQVQYLDIRDPNDIESAFRVANKTRADFVLVLTSPIINPHRKEVVNLAAKTRLPTIYSTLEFVEDRGLMTYGVSINDLYRRAATYVDKILKGAKPADLPVEQPTRFELVINLKTAKQIGLTIPPNVLARADRVIR